MWKVTWRNLVARKVRLALSAFAIVLGVAFVAGSFIFTDAMGGAFSGIIKGSTADVEIAPTGATDFDSQQDARTIPAAVVERLRALPEAESVHPWNQLLTLYVIGKDGELVGGNGPPGLAFSDVQTRAITGKQIITYIDGGHPRGTS
ncbi:MAG: ABC transporter permease, partial [Actinomycetes bacterium]